MSQALKKAPLDAEEELLVRFALKRQVVTEEKMEELLSFQRGERERGRLVSIEDLLLERGLVTERQLASLRSARDFFLQREKDRVLCKIFCKVQYATQEQLDLALAAQAKLYKEKTQFKSVADILFEDGVISAKKRAAVINAALKLAKSQPSGVSNDQLAEGKIAGSPDDGKTLPPASKNQTEPSEALKFPTEGTRILYGELFDVIVSGDLMEAHISLTGPASEQLDPLAVNSALLGFGIKSGLVEDELLFEWLKNKDKSETKFKIAQGTPPIQGRSAEIAYHFRSRPKWDELVESKVKIDFKDKGDIPHVKKGDLLAEKTPMVKEQAGCDIYGKTMAVEKALDKKLLAGAGTELSPDGLKAFATVDGRPELSPFGKISVSPELNISGDVGFESGNVEFNGHIKVSGVVQDGFTVKGGSLTAREISKATIEVTGDVVVYGGVLGADIRAQGSVRAFHIHASRVEALGDVVAEKGIVDSKIVTSSKCLTNRGTVLASSICARMGVEAGQIGSDRSGPCTVTFGVDLASEREVARLKEIIAIKEKENEALLEHVKSCLDHFSTLEKSAGDLAQVQDRSVREQRALSDELKKWKEAGDQKEAARVEQAVELLDSKIRSREDELNALLDRQDELKEQSYASQERMEEIEKEVSGLKEEIEAFYDWSRNQKEKPCVKVLSTIFAGSVIKGAESSAVLKSDVKGVLIREIKVPLEEKGSGPAFKIKIANLP